MNFLLTAYIYPLKDQIVLSRNLNISLDNPRKEGEVQAVTEYIRQAYTIESAFQYSEEAIRQGLVDFLNEYTEENEHIREFHDSYGDLGAYELLARMWIIARYDDEGKYEWLKQEAKKLSEEGRRGFFLLVLLCQS